MPPFPPTHQPRHVNVDIHLVYFVCIGVLHWELDADKHADDPALEEIRQDRGYSYQVQ